MGNNGHPVTFTHSNRQLWALAPTALFLVVVFLILWLQPTLIWTRGIDSVTRSSAMILAAALALFVSFGVLQRWLSPFEIRLERDQLVARPLLGPARRVPYSQIVELAERPRSFFRHAPELELRLRGAPRLVISGDIKGYDQLQRTLRHRVRPRPAPTA
jgi:hypothetical protein